MKQNSIQILFRLIGLISPLLLFMICAILLGVLGFICANFLTVLATLGIIEIIKGNHIERIVVGLIVFGILRGFLRYGEQSCNHYIAFKLLALIRDKVFGKLRTLAPAKLEGKDKGNLISIITSDIELLEVFYAHTISPILIAFFMLVIMMVFFGYFHYVFALYALFAYSIVGVILPIFTHYQSKGLGNRLRNESGNLSSFILENLRGQKEIIQYDAFDSKLDELKKRSQHLSMIEKEMKKVQATNTSLTGVSVMVLSLGMLILSNHFVSIGQIDASLGVLVSVTMLSSFSPFIALSSLSSTLQPTLAAAQRVLSILDEEPQIKENESGKTIENVNVDIEHVTFAYDNEVILNDVDLHFEKNEIIGIVGKSGSGKSTLLKLLMRFWDVQKGNISIDGKNIQTIQTSSLRQCESYMTQQTHLFHDSILNNIKIAKLDATLDEVIEACKKASIHDFIESLPKGYDTLVSECGESLSGGEKQRIGLARAFCHDADLMLFDEPTSNLDSLNEAIILKALNEQSNSKTILLVSHRPSTIQWCNRIASLKQERES